MDCRAGCGACCIEISISSPLPGMREGKPAGIRCPHLDDHGLCQLFGKPERPAICEEFKAAEWICGSTREQATQRIRLIELQTRPS